MIRVLEEIDDYPWADEDGRIYKSAAVVATNSDGYSVLLHYCGPAIDWHVSQYSADTSELGLDTGSEGIQVWEGSMGSVRCSTVDYGDEWDFEIDGVWREPTDEEWEFIRRNECPWDKETLAKWK